MSSAEGLEVRRVICHNGGGGCHGGCGLLAFVDKKTGRLVDVKGNSEHPTNQSVSNYTCQDRAANFDIAKKFLYHPDQLLYPLKRVGERGKGKWQRITWDQALDEVAEKLKEIKEKYGPESLFVAEGTMRSGLYWARARFLNLFGNPANVIDPITVCFGPGLAVQAALTGAYPVTVDFQNAKCIVFDSQNQPESYPTFWQYSLYAQKRGATIIVIDPRCTEAARNADLWLQIRPGSDTALWMSWINIIIAEGLYNKEFVEKWTNAPFLVRTEGPKILRGIDIVKDGGRENFVVWDEITKTPKIYYSRRFEYEKPDVEPAMTGTYRVKLIDGSSVECKTALQMITEAVSKYRPEEVEKITWIPKEKIIQGARLWATHGPACLWFGVAPDQTGRPAGYQHMCRVLLKCLCGYIDIIGSEIYSDPLAKINGTMYVTGSDLQLLEHLPFEAREKQLGSDQHKLMAWPHYNIRAKHWKRVWGEVLGMTPHEVMVASPHLFTRAILTGKPYKPRALISWAGNPAMWMPNTKLVYKALTSPTLELHVNLDHFLTPTGDLADYTLPVATKTWERVYCATSEDGWGIPMTIGEGAVAPLSDERRDDYQFWHDLGHRIGQVEYWPWKNYREQVEYRLQPIGLTIDEAAKKGMIFIFPEPEKYKKINPNTGKPRGFATESGRAEIYSLLLEEIGYNPLPKYLEPAESPVSTPVVAKEYPLILDTGGRFRPQFHSEYRHWGDGMREQHPWPLLEIHPETARNLSPLVADGDWVWIETRRGRIKQKARYNPGIHPKVVNAESHWWYPELPGEEPHLHGLWLSNANVLTLDEPEAVDPFCGCWQNRALLCKVYKAEGPPIP